MQPMPANIWDAASILVHCATDGETYVARVNTQPLGLARPPATWGRVKTMLQRAIATLAKVPLFACVGDVFAVEQSAAAHSALSAAKEIINLCVFGLEDSKDPELATPVSSPGRTLQLQKGHATTAFTPVRLATLYREFKLRLDNNVPQTGSSLEVARKADLGWRYGRADWSPLRRDSAKRRVAC